MKGHHITFANLEKLFLSLAPDLKVEKLYKVGALWYVSYSCDNTNHPSCANTASRIGKDIIPKCHACETEEKDKLEQTRTENWFKDNYPEAEILDFSKGIYNKRKNDLYCRYYCYNKNHGLHGNITSVLIKKSEKLGLLTCRTCVAEPKTHTQEYVKATLEKVGVTLISPYVNYKTKIDILCPNGCKIKALFNQVIDKNTGKPRCKNCNQFIFERGFRFALETIFNNTFLKCRPPFLTNGNSSLELDGYNNDLKIAFEYNGNYHYDTKTFRQNNLEKVKQHDEYKKAKCEELGIKLLIFPHYETKKFEDIKNSIKIKCDEIGIILPNNFNDIEIDFSKMVSSHQQPYMEKFIAMCASKDLTVKSKVWQGKRVKLEICCNSCQYKWSTLPRNIDENHQGCPKFCNKKTDDLIIKRLENKLNVKVISEKYINNRDILKWKCLTCSTIFEMKTSYLSAKRIDNKCIYCNKIKKQLQFMSDFFIPA